jgi:hypothetical protein
VRASRAHDWTLLAKRADRRWIWEQMTKPVQIVKQVCGAPPGPMTVSCEPGGNIRGSIESHPMGPGHGARLM